MKLVKIFLLLLMCSCSRNTTEVSKLSQIPKEDQARIERFLSYLVWDESFAYVLFGSKPLSVSNQDKIHSPEYLEIYKSPAYELESLWGTWEKYAHLFPMKEFMFLTGGNDKVFELYLLNKSNCFRVIEANLALFQEKTGCNLNAFEMFNYIIANSSGNNYRKRLNKSQCLYGIFYGYGTENSIGYENYYSVKRDPPSGCGDHIDEEDLTLPHLPFFASFSREETKQLIADYRKQREEILKIYYKKDFLETTLARLTSQSHQGA